NFVMVMDYIKDGDLRRFLDNTLITFQGKLKQLKSITEGLKAIHQKGLVHRDLHPGNILVSNSEIQIMYYITDLGLSQPANYQKQKGKIFGVLPYVAPEVLKGGYYSPASDVYAFAIIAYELFAQRYPYSELDLSDEDLAIAVCRGERPKLDELKIPQLLKDLIKKCWAVDPEQRPTATELTNTLSI
ncbi:5524_t:CDS:1, partial [Paraglomus occultum]